MIDFTSDDWTYALREGMGAQSVRLQSGGLITCFRVGPFRVAYPDFLIGSPRDLTEDGVEERIEQARSLRADLIRFQAPHIPTHQGKVTATHRLGTVTIPSLQDWAEREFEKPRRTANREHRSAIEIRPGHESDGSALHRLYLSTIRRHHGASRYRRRYFDLIAAPASIVAEIDGQICGFVCAGFHGNRACYMHGGHAPEHRKHYVSDQLFLKMLRVARDAGINNFDFLPSPPDQTSLISYKQAWGGMNEDLNVTDITLNPLRARCFGLALKISNKLSTLRGA